MGVFVLLVGIKQMDAYRCKLDYKENVRIINHPESIDKITMK